jgi:hypothetical protein
MLAGGLVAQNGQWISAYNHPNSTGFVSPFNAINLAVIPGVGSNPNDVVIAWDSQFQPPPTSPVVAWPQRFTVGNPESRKFANFTVTVPFGPLSEFYGDLFCAGHCWLPDGRLFVAGGNTQYAAGAFPFIGSRFAGIWDPAAPRVAPDFGWDFSLARTGKVLRLKRWYPTVTLISRNLVMVSGGSERSPDGAASRDPYRARTTYEVFDIFAGDWVRDPANPAENMLFSSPFHYFTTPSNPTPTLTANPALDEYPRLHLLSNNRVFLSGQWRESAFVVDAASPTGYYWADNMLSLSSFQGNPLSYAASVLVPNVGNVAGREDEIMAIGGSNWTNALVVDTSQRILAGSGTGPQSPPLSPIGMNATPGNQVPQWNPLSVEQMVRPRMVGNAVLGPDGDIVMIGGSSDHYWQALPNPVLVTEVWNRAIGWTADATQSSPRMYHSTAGLLPSGRMVSAGGDVRTFDWEVYEPRYMHRGTPPRWAGTWAGLGRIALNWNTSYDVNLATGSPSVARVVLMRACSTTHHSDMDQRYVELATTPVSSTMVTIRTPTAPNGGSATNSVRALPGYYLMFLVTLGGAASTGRWVYLP